MGRSLVAAVCLAFTLGPMASALALADGHQEFEIDGILVRADSPWPAALKQGWFPVFVELENQSLRDRNVRLVLFTSNPPEKSQVVQEVELSRGELRKLELLAPAWGGTANESYLHVEADGAHPVGRNNLGAPLRSDPAQRVAVILSMNPARSVSGWTIALSTERLLGSGSRSRNNNMLVACATFEQMPLRNEGYSSLDLVVIDTHGGPPTPERLDPVLAWVQLGGTLAIVGPCADELALQVPALERWLEPRFAIGRRDETLCYACGLGTIIIGPVLDSPGTWGQYRALRWVTTSNLGTVPGTESSRLDQVLPSLPGLGELPYKVFAGLLLLFAITIGPLNFYLVKRKGRPALLLVTIPSIALAASSLFIAYGVFYQGLDLQTGSLTLTVLDQRAHSAATIERRLLFAGMVPSSGLRPGAGTSCYLPLRYGNVMRQSPGRVHADLTDGLALSGAFLPPRTPVMQQIHTHRTARGRVELAREGDRWSAVNAMDARLEECLLCDGRGNYHLLSTPLEIGARASLEPMERTAAWKSLDGDVWEILRVDGTTGGLPPATYAARIGRNVFGDDCGIETNEKVGEHFVWGIVDMEGEL